MEIRQTNGNASNIGIQNHQENKRKRQNVLDVQLPLYRLLALQQTA
jgi:hypothetical protein